jgi:hypothetical protein
MGCNQDTSHNAREFLDGHLASCEIALEFVLVRLHSCHKFMARGWGDSDSTSFGFLKSVCNLIDELGEVELGGEGSAAFDDSIRKTHGSSPSTRIARNYIPI